MKRKEGRNEQLMRYLGYQCGILSRENFKQSDDTKGKMIKVTNLLNLVPKYNPVKCFYISKESIEVCTCLSFI